MAPWHSAACLISPNAPATHASRVARWSWHFNRVNLIAGLNNTGKTGLLEAIFLALTDGPLRAAALDTFAAEPIDPADPLLTLANVVLTPHVAWLTLETLERCVERAAVNLTRLAAGEE